MMRFLLAAGFIASQGLAQVVINEFQYDDAGTDDFEFVELYNVGGTGPVDISGWRIVNRDGGSPLYGGVGTDPTQTVPAATILLPGQFYVFGNALVPNVNQVMVANSLENDNESIELWDATNVLVDSVCYEMGQGAFGNTFPSFPQEGNGLFGDLATGQITSTIGRMTDGVDTNNNGRDFACTMPPSPGATNNQANVLPYSDNFDTGTYLGTVTAWDRGFVAARYIDPTVNDTQNVHAKLPSPQGGLAMGIWDNTGGGNAVQLNNAPVSDVVFECWTYIEPTMTPINPNIGPPYNAATVGTANGTYNFADGEAWIAGIRGTVGANANPADVTGTYYADIANGVGYRQWQITGLAWVGVRTRNGSTVSLVDFHDGAIPPATTTTTPPYFPTANNNFTVLGSVNIIAGVNDGWQRIRIHAQGNVVVGNFGGTYGADDGARFSATTTTTQAGKIYLGYREAILMAPPNNEHPQIFDAIDIHVPTTAKSFFGTGSLTSLAQIPVCDADGLPIIGSTGFGFRSSNCLPFGIAYTVVGTNVLGFGVPIPGAPAGAFLYQFPFDFEFFQFTDGLGKAFTAVPIPFNVALLGLAFGAQTAAFDPALGGSLPIATSAQLLMTVGN